MSISFCWQARALAACLHCHGVDDGQCWARMRILYGARIAVSGGDVTGAMMKNNVFLP